MKIRENDLPDHLEAQKKADKRTPVSRRQFLKKTAYATPSLIILGSLVKPVTAAAGSDDIGFPTSSKSDW